MSPGFGFFRSLPLAARAQDAAGAWAEAWRSTSFRAHVVATPIALAATLDLLGHVLPWVESRSNVAPLADPVLAMLAPRDLTWLTFTLIYAGLIVGLVRLVGRPRA